MGEGSDANTKVGMERSAIEGRELKERTQRGTRKVRSRLGCGSGRGCSRVRDERRVARKRRALGAHPTIPGCADCPPETGP